MGTLAPMNYIEITESDGKMVSRIAGTRIRVSEIVNMHLKHESSIDWIVENFEVLDHAMVHAALAYYYDHQDEIEAELNAPEIIPEDAMTLDKLKARINDRQQT